jgi:hypothetical protein
VAFRSVFVAIVTFALIVSAFLLNRAGRAGNRSAERAFVRAPKVRRVPTQQSMVVHEYELSVHARRA